MAHKLLSSCGLPNGVLHCVRMCNPRMLKSQCFKRSEKVSEQLVAYYYAQKLSRWLVTKLSHT